MTLEQAQLAAQRCANRTGSTVLVYKMTHRVNIPEDQAYGFDFTLPTWGTRIGDRIEPETPSQTIERLNRK